MAATVEFLPVALSEVDDAIAWYREREPTIAMEFADAIDEAGKTIGVDPESWPRRGRTYRSFSLRTFPYELIYRYDFGVVRIIAVAHTARKPGYWKRRGARG